MPPFIIITFEACIHNANISIYHNLGENSKNYVMFCCCPLKGTTNLMTRPIK